MNRLLLLTAMVSAVVAVSVLPGSDVDHVQYLRNFGYISKDSSFVQSDNDMSKAISEFQVMAGIEQTGSMNAETLTMMRLPRCGHHDQAVSAGALQRRIKRYSLMGTTWGRMSLTYKIKLYTNQLSHSSTDKAARQAFAYWAKVSPLTFRQIRGSARADINIKFAAGSHGDGYPFDGKLGVLAHAFQPRNGRAHFDDDEEWVLGDHTYGKINIRQVMTHEFGHLLGLGHSTVNAAVMAPFYKGYEPTFHLDYDDILGIQTMYGSNNGRKTTTVRTTTTTEMTTTTRSNGGVGICADPSFDAATMDRFGFIYAFKGANYYKINSWAPKKAYSIRSKFAGIPNYINAVLTVSGSMYFFKGNQVYKYRRGRVQSSYPKNINTVFRGLPSRIDSAFTVGSYAYFTAGGVYYKSTVSRGVVSTAVRVAAFRNSPRTIDALFYWNRYALIAFSGGKHFTSYRNNKSFGGPESTKAWLGC